MLIRIECLFSSQQPHFQQQGVRRPWNAELFGCCDEVTECCFAYFCTLCYMYRLFDKAGEGCCSCFWAGLVPLRTKIRTERGIEVTATYLQIRSFQVFIECCVRFYKGQFV